MPRPPLHQWFQRYYWTRRLKLAIRKHDLPGAKLALCKGAKLDGWKGKGPYLHMGIHSPGLRMTSKTALNMAFHWWAPPAMFQILLEAGAHLDGFDYSVDSLGQRGKFLDQLGKFGRYANWTDQHAGAIECMCQAIDQERRLRHGTSAATGQGALRRL